jgi:hypothetical protein
VKRRHGAGDEAAIACLKRAVDASLIGQEEGRLAGGGQRFRTFEAADRFEIGGIGGARPLDLRLVAIDDAEPAAAKSGLRRSASS